MEASAEERAQANQIIDHALCKLESYAENFTPTNEEFDTLGDFVFALLKGARNSDEIGVRSALVRARYVGWWAPYVEIHEHHGVVKIDIRNAFKKIMLPPSQADLDSFYYDKTMLPDQIRSFFDCNITQAISCSRKLALQRREIIPGCPIVMHFVRGVLYLALTINITAREIPDRNIDVTVQMED